MKFANERFPDKIFYISNGWTNGTREVKQKEKGVQTKSMNLRDDQYRGFLKMLENNGWISK
mgnify:CR=1 FL=1|tara:strand:+ start:1832 stop:2014 length:183 start_codon:yes stop_codon:yes gene_type:complete